MHLQLADPNPDYLYFPAELTGFPGNMFIKLSQFFPVSRENFQRMLYDIWPYQIQSNTGSFDIFYNEALSKYDSANIKELSARVLVNDDYIGPPTYDGSYYTQGNPGGTSKPSVWEIVGTIGASVLGIMTGGSNIFQGSQPPPPPPPPDPITKYLPLVLIAGAAVLILKK